MDIDLNSLDPDLRTAKLSGIASASFGLLSLCLAIIPICGGITSILGVVLGLYSLKTEHSKIAIAGVILSGLGVLITIVYALFLFLFQK
ncbi:MAG: hypothetical protein HXY35_11825 [Chloroflexi bacterium]|nr:hypothetical protein [Chloroflexota bacterium]